MISKQRRGLDVDVGLSVLDQIARMVEQVDRSLYEEPSGRAIELNSIYI